MKRGVALAGGAVVACSLFASVRAHAAGCGGRPTDPAGFQGYSYAGATAASFAGSRVLVHYATTGANAVEPATTRADSVPDTVALAAQVGDTALAKYASMGFKLPPSDAACTSNGGDDKIDIYLVAFSGADGSTIAESCNGNACSSFLLSESTFIGSGYKTPAEGFRTVIAHELFHVIQNGYDSQLDRFWAEGTAQWGMKNVYPDLADFENQLPPFFSESSRSIDTQPSGVTAGFLYGAAIWPLFLTLRHGPTTVREILEKEADATKSLVATDAVLVSKGSSLAEDYPLFGAWNAATKTLAATNGYPDAAKYPGVKTATLEDGATAITSGLAYYAYRGTLDASSKISLETDATRVGGVVVAITDGKPDLSMAAKLPANIQGDVLVVVAGITTKKTDAPFIVHIGAADPALGTDAGVPPTASTSSSGGCTTTGSEPADGFPTLPALAFAFAGLVLVRVRARVK